MKILIVEDNQGDYDYICDVISEELDLSYDILRSETLKDAEWITDSENPDLVLLDLGLPDSFGIKTAEHMVNHCPYTPIIVLTGYKNEDVGLEAIKIGAQDFISKNNITTSNLLKSIKYSMERKKYIEDFNNSQQKISYLLDYTSDGVCVVDSSLYVQEINTAFIKLFDIASHEIYSQKLTDATLSYSIEGLEQKLLYVLESGNHFAFDYNFENNRNLWYEIKLDPYPKGVIIFARDISARIEQNETLNRLNESLQKSTDSTIGLLAKLVELKEPYTAGHQERVANLSQLIADELDISESRKKALYLAARIHDIGKVAIPSEILVKPSELSATQMSLVHFHVQYGYDLVKEMDGAIAFSDIILQHHERIDGSGYPNGLKGSETLKESKILMVADVVDAMLSHRPYRSAYSVQDVIFELENNKNILYDLEVVNSCVKILKYKGIGVIGKYN